METGNLLLNRLAPHTVRVLKGQQKDYTRGTVLIKEDETPDYVFFPHHGAVVSIVRTTTDGSTVEAGVIGSEGALHVQTIITAPGPIGSQAIVQIEGVFTRVDAHGLRDQFNNDTALRDALLGFTSAFLEQVTQNLVCNRLHAIEQRLAKWLLTVRDRVEKDDLELTHDFLSHMLGIHRPGVTIAVAALELDGLIAHSRNLITIRDHQGLVARSCECFEVLHERLLELRTTLAA